MTAIDGTTLVFGADGYSQAITLYDATDIVAVGTITVKADGTYSFTAANPVNNPVGAVATFTVTDGDLDASSANITFTITDANIPTGGVAQAAVDDDGLSGGNPASTTGDLNANYGADGVQGTADDDLDGASSEASFRGKSRVQLRRRRAGGSGDRLRVYDRERCERGPRDGELHV